MPGTRGLSPADDAGRRADGADDEAAASIDWAASNGVAFDHGKTEAAIFRRRKTPPRQRRRLAPTLSHSTRRGRCGSGCGWTPNSLSGTITPSG